MFLTTTRNPNCIDKGEKKLYGSNFITVFHLFTTFFFSISLFVRLVLLSYFCYGKTELARILCRKMSRYPRRRKVSTCRIATKNIQICCTTFMQAEINDLLGVMYRYTFVENRADTILLLCSLHSHLSSKRKKKKTLKRRGHFSQFFAKIEGIYEDSSSKK